MRTIFFHIHGTTSLSAVGSSFFKNVSGLAYPHLFTRSSEPALIALQDAPGALIHFEALYKHADEGDRFYFQWSGNLGENAWEEAATFLTSKIKGFIHDAEPTKVIILSHSHGGHIARLSAKKLLSRENVIFEIITNATPLSIDPPILMPTNVKKWYHFYDNSDPIAYVGSSIMQNSIYSPVTRRIEAILDVLPSAPEGASWKSFELHNGYFDQHNKSMDKDAAKIISSVYEQSFDEYSSLSGLKGEGAR